MIAFMLAQVVAAQLLRGTPPPSNAPNAPLAPAVVLDRYAAALKKLKEPRVISFSYTIEEAGPRSIVQTHLVFRSGSDERDETISVDGKRLEPPKVRVFRNRRNRYTIGLLAPRAASYTFRYVGSRKDARHIDYLFSVTPRAPNAFRVTDLTLDGVRFLPLAIGFATRANGGAGSVDFGSNARWWVPYVATARANVGADAATERLTFYTYRFPLTLPPSTFTQARRPLTPTTGLNAPLPRSAIPTTPTVTSTAVPLRAPLAPSRAPH